MKEIIVAVLVGVGALLFLGVGKHTTYRAGFAADNSAEQALALVDGYVQIGNSRPLHLAHGDVERQNVRLGDSVTFWITVSPAEEDSPCDRRSEEPCSLVVGVEPLQGDDASRGYTFNAIDFRINGPNGLTTVVPILRDRAPLGEADVIFRITTTEETVFEMRIPVEIR